jgi:hypothetical protein
VDESLEHAQSALALARQLAQSRAEIVTHHLFCMVYLERHEPQSALSHARLATKISRAADARRFEPESLMLEAASQFLLGETDAAHALLRAALDISADHIAYCGPWILGLLARVTPDAGERAESLRLGEEILDRGSPAHNHLSFYTAAIDLSLQARDFHAALRYAQRLEAAFAQEPMPMASFVAESARLLVAVGRGERGAQLLGRIEAHIELGRSRGLVRTLHALERAAFEASAEADAARGA